MAQIACITNGLTGLLFASFEMVRRLKADGHHVTYMAPPFAKDAVVREGLPFFELPAFGADAASDMEDVAERLRSCDFDLVLIDTELQEVILASQAAGAKTILLNTWMSIWKHPGLPPLHRSIQTGSGLFGSPLGIEFAWRQHQVARHFKHAARRIWHGRNYRVTRLRNFARRIGFPHSHEFDFDNWLVPFSFKTMPILVLHAHEFEFPHKPRDHVHYVGPMVNPNRLEAPTHLDDQTTIDAVLSRRKEGRIRLVFGGFGSHFIADPALLKNVFMAFTDQPEWELVLPLGEKVADIDMSVKPANVHVVAWAPQLTLLQYADAAIVHGGINTIDECIHFGTPMLAYSGGLTDMSGNVARLVHHGLGVEGDRRHDRPELIAERLQKIMLDQAISERLRTQCAAAKRYVDDRVLERTVDRFLDGDLAGSAEPLTVADGASRRGAASRP